MQRRTQRFAAFFRYAVALIVSFNVLCHSHTALAYKPGSPQVKQMVEAGLKYLEGAGEGSREGALCLQGLAMVKAGRPASNPRIQEAIASATKMATVVSKGGGSEGYAEAVACILLCEVDSDQYSSEITALYNDVLKLQQSNGAWSYRRTGVKDSDTSLTQYGMLALWTADSYGRRAPQGPVAQAARWLMQTQTQDGGFCYKPNIGDPNSRQSTLSCTTAGGGSLYMAAYLLGFKAKAEKKDDGLPPALELVETTAESETRLQTQGIDATAIQRACVAGDGWVSRHFGPQNQNAMWTYYYLYGLERHMSFRDLVQGKKPEAEPAWYNTGVTYLMNQQKKDGSWAGPNGGEIDTSFAILFLVRSTQKSIGTAILNEGVLVGGQGLPKNITNATMQDGKVVTPKAQRDVDDLLKIVESADNKEFDPDAFEGMSLHDDIEKRTNQLVRLREMVSNEDYNARRVAVRTLAEARELDNVPALIYALTDEDGSVVMSARDGLRFISRRFSGFGMPDLKVQNEKMITPTPDQQQAVAEKWKKWYLSIRPDGELIE
ncbi:MAG: hypothetical protein H8E44_31520 [Planctomycetes bacterium]|nr:hypothetical protein [Planctomycetota bacterium]